ncbi:phytanoyl-CoA dioxygenase-like protein [Lindgomyces ingoldianus]|uniref:Phytanoyl-CoA dioxygenase-like protein n=1 Tax=Lindgomyces ingoldianus TaxID=673940 RepID=A0ACB6QMY4_9PLEO|nr:phytanoyl-CoA dioxygenase-like protein [Lindgomyces ingoldianus]KAF2467948.1 phytanoyl-CoA dioxygenase-like protein [Lindgomyces ingoldianus]
MIDATHLNGSSRASVPVQPRLFNLSKPPSVEAFDTLCSQPLRCDYPLASSIQSNIPIYKLPPFKSLTAEQCSALQDEWYHILLSGPGVFVTKGLYKDTTLLDKMNSVFSDIIAHEKQGSRSRGDHFASSGQNDRIWNSFSKHCALDPPSFLSYYSNPYLPLISSTWLGPSHRITAQVNIVKPGAAPQVSHRDYHLGFQDAVTCSQIPKAAQVATQFLTLQGAVAHSHMPLESGPTRLLPFSQMFEEGYMAYRLPEFRDYFLAHYVSLPLEKGDGLFFNPALFHAAGKNESKDVMRSANLLQISSAFGKPMETIDSLPIIETCWNPLMKKYKVEGMSEEVRAFVAAVGDGYPFPTNLDNRAPQSGGMAPESEQDVMLGGLVSGLEKAEILDKIRRIRVDAKP